MDPKSFDRLARSTADGLSRRRVMAWFGAGSAASLLAAPGIALAQAETTCTLHLVGTVRLGPSAGELITQESKSPGELKGDLTFTPGKEGAIDKGELLLADGKKLAVVGQVVGRAVNLRITLADKRVVVLVGTAAEDLGICHGDVDGLLTGPEPGDLGDWHSTAEAKKTASGSTGSTAPTATTGTGGGGGGKNCPDGQGDCGAGCIDLLSDPVNCGACGSVCDPGQGCTAGKCAAGEECQAGEVKCGDMGCVDTSSDPNNCGECGMACEATLICINGGCCLEDEICDGVCTNVLGDPMNCGACGNACADGQTCDGGACTDACLDGEVMCADVCTPTGTEMNCMDCGDACGVNELCCGDLGCIDVMLDVNNCGGCFAACGQDQTCTDGTCG